MAGRGEAGASCHGASAPPPPRARQPMRVQLCAAVFIASTSGAAAGGGEAADCPSGASPSPTLPAHAARRRLGAIGGHIQPVPDVRLQQQSAERAGLPPHLLLVVASGVAASDVGVGTTPTLDRLSGGGVQLTLYMASRSAPSRGALLTGRYPARWGAAECLSWQADCIPKALPLLPAMLKDQAGYATHLLGLWHGGFADVAMTPTARGYDTFYGAYLPHSNFSTSAAPVFGWSATFLPPPTTLHGSKAQRETCPHWNQMGCLLDAFEKICGTAEQMEQPAEAELLAPCKCSSFARLLSKA